MKKKIGFALLILITILLVLWGRENYTWKSRSMFAMDTYCTIKIKGGGKVIDKMEGCIEKYDKKMNAYSADSAVYALNESEESEDKEIVSLSKQLYTYYKKTGGAFDFTLKKLSDAWGFETEHPHVPEKIVFSDFGADRISFTDSKVRLNGVEAGFGAVTKGYVTDRLVDIMNESGVKDAVLDLGGNVYSKGTHKIGIKEPSDTESALACAVTVCDRAVVTSGVYQRYFIDDSGKRRHHILDPKTGYPAENDILSVTVIGDSGTVCDVLSTAFLVMGKEKTFEMYQSFGAVEVIVLTSDTLYCTKGIAGNVSDVNGKYKQVVM